MNARICLMRLCLLGALLLSFGVRAAVPGSNQPPVAVNDNVNVTSGVLTPINVLANDYDPDLDPISIWSFTPPLYGTMYQTSNQFWYQAYSNYCGPDSFTYRIADNRGGVSSNATVFITVTGCMSNSPPVANGDSAVVNAGGSVVIPVLSNDSDPNGDPLSISSYGQSVYGSVSQSGTQLIYYASFAYCGPDGFNYTISDGRGGFATASVSIMVNCGPSNQPPVAVNDSATVPSGVSTLINVLSNDYDPEFNPISIWSYGQPFYGSVFQSNGQLYYQSIGGYTGPDSFGYTITDNNGGFGSATVSVTVTNGGMTNPPVSADLSLTKYSSWQSNVMVGQQIIYTLSAFNSGPATATNVVVRDTIPSGTTYVSASGGACTFNSGLQRVDCNVGTLGSGGNATVYVTVQVASTGTLVNCATVSSDTSDSSAANNTSCVTNNGVAAQADLSLTKYTSTTNALSVGNQIIYTLGAFNGGPSVASNVVIRDTLPAGVTYVSATGGACVYDTNLHRVDCDVGILGVSGQATVYVTVQVAAQGGNLVNCATIFGSTSDANASNNTSCVTNTTTQPSADLQITKTASSNSVVVGTTVVFNLTARNNGPSTITNQIEVSEVIPSGFEYLSDNSAGTGAFYSFGLGQWVMPTGLVAGAMRTLAITVRATNAGTYTNIAIINVPAGITDPNTNNNRSAVIVTNTTPTADLRMGKTASTNTVKVGQQFTFTLSLTNAGPDTVTNDVAITDVIPSAFHYVSDTSGGANGSYSWGLGQWTVVPGASGSVRSITITVLATNAGTFTNVAVINVPLGIHDPNTNNNRREAAVSVIKPQADLRIGKIANTNAVYVGSNITYTVFLTNGGPDSVTNPVTVLDVVPAGTMYVSHTSSAAFGDYYSQGSHRWFLNGLGASGAVASITITVVTTVNGPYTNTAVAEVPPDINDPNTNNNSATVIVTNLPTFKITGRVVDCTTNGPGLTNATLTLTGNGITNVTMSGNNGTYMFTNLQPFTNYVITPSLTNYTFLPTNLVVRVTNDITVSNIVGFSYVVRGLVREGTNAPVVPMPATLITLMATNGSLMRSNYTDTNGIYVFTNVPAGVYKLTAHTNGFKFVPTNLVLLTITNSLSLTNCTNIVNWVGEAKRVELRALELVQVIQDWKNRVPLVSNKTTTVRAHLQLYGTNRAPLLVNGARLTLQGPAGTTNLSALNPDGDLTVVTNNAHDVRSNFTDSLNFRLPPLFTRGTLTATLEWTNGVIVPIEPAEPGGTASNAQVIVSFRPMPALPINWVYLSWTDTVFRAGSVVKITNQPAANLPQTLADRLLAIYPIERLTTNHTQARWPHRQGAPNTWLGVNTPVTISNEFQLNSLLTGLRSGSGAPANGGPIWYGMVPGTFVRGLGTLPGYVAHGSDAIAAQYNLVAHELGHNLGRNHAASSAIRSVTNITGPVGNRVTNIWKSGRCDEWATNTAPDFPMLMYGAELAPVLGPWNPPDEMIFGFDHNQRVLVNPSNTFDIMSYCNTGYSKPIAGSTSFQWMSFYNYTNIMNAIINRWGSGGAPAATDRKDLGDYLLVRGQLNEVNSTFALLPIYSLPLSPPPPPPEPGPYVIHLIGQGGALLGTIPFNADFGASEFDPTADDPTLPFEGQFNVWVPQPPDLTRVEIWRGANLLGARNGTPNAPVVQVTAPAPGQNFGPGTITVQWFGSDLDGDPLNYMVQYSRDGGQTWDTLAIDHTETSLGVEQEFLMSGPASEFRVIASDSFNSSRDAMDNTFVVQNHPPVIEIQSPGFQQNFSGEQMIVFEASAYDFDDGPLGDNVQWSSSRDGALGNGGVLLLESTMLSEGQHVITAAVTDTGGLSAMASVPIQVFRGQLPVLRIARDESNVQLAWSASLTGYILQATTNLTSPNWITITNAPLIIGDDKTVTRSAEGASRYYRLFKP